MAQIAFGIDQIPDALFQHLGFGKAAVALALPDEFAVAGDLEDPAGTRYQGYFPKFRAEGGEQFLRHPGCAQEPLALRAIGDGYPGLRAHAALSRAMVSSSTSKFA